MSELMLSICVPVYNHEKYIRETLDSILMQKTKYSYEVLVGEDASTDNTRKILKEYEKNFPNVFQMFYRKENMRNDPIGNAVDLRSRAKGKYVITLEGDDFWTDEYKIDKQIEFLESHPDFLAVAHNCTVVGSDSLPNGENYRQCEDEIYTIKHFRRGILPGQLGTWMQRNNAGNRLYDESIILPKILAGDRRLFFAALCNGKIYCIQKSMSAYRHVTSGGSSYSANYKYDFEKKKAWHLLFIEYAKKINSKEGLDCAEQLYFNEVTRALIHRKISISQFRECIKMISKKFFRMSSFMNQVLFDKKYEKNHIS